MTPLNYVESTAVVVLAVAASGAGLLLEKLD
jgi:hypothetical protein